MYRDGDIGVSFYRNSNIIWVKFLYSVAPRSNVDNSMKFDKCLIWVMTCTVTYTWLFLALFILCYMAHLVNVDKYDCKCEININ